MRANSKKSAGAQDSGLNDLGISYAAVVSDDENPLAFIYFGITGGYLGQFSLLPYYVKVSEYNHAESRDLWEYELNLSEEETKAVLRHIWELETSGYFFYYFFGENCSYQILTILEAIKPEWSISDFFIYVIPAETVKRITEIPDAIRSVTFRPSLRRRMNTRFHLLSKDENNFALQLAENDKAVPSSANAETLEASIALLEYQRGYDSSHKDRNKFPKANRMRELLVARAALGTGSRKQNTADHWTLPVNEEWAHQNWAATGGRPDLGHGPRRFGFRSGAQWGLGRCGSAGKECLQPYQEISFKFAYHDLLTHDGGYTPFSQIDFPGFRLRYTDFDHKLNLEEIHGVSSTSLTPWSRLEHPLSWRFQVAYISPKDFRCEYCHVAEALAATGITAPLPNGILSLLLGASLQAGSSLHLQNLTPAFRVLPDAKLLLGWNPHHVLKLLTSAEVYFDPLHGDASQGGRNLTFERWTFGGSWTFSPQKELRLNFEQFTHIGAESNSRQSSHYRDLSLTAFYYF